MSCCPGPVYYPNKYSYIGPSCRPGRNKMLKYSTVQILWVCRQWSLPLAQKQNLPTNYELPARPSLVQAKFCLASPLPCRLQPLFCPAAAARQVPRSSSAHSPALSTHQVCLCPPTPFLPPLCETEHPKPNLKLFTHLYYWPCPCTMCILLYDYYMATNECLPI